MKTFFIKLASIAVIMLLIIVGMHIVKIIRSQDNLESTYSIDPQRDVLVVGSSDAGCSITEGAEFHNMVAWTSRSSISTISMRLKEFERRNQLGCVKTIIVPFSVKTLSIQADTVLSERFYSDLPMSWRYFGETPGSVFSLLRHVATHLRFPMGFTLSFEEVPVSKSLAERSDQERQEYFKKATALSKNMILEGNLIAGWENSVKSAIGEMLEICQRHDIRLVFYQAPFYEVFRRNVPKASLDKEAELIDWIRGKGIEYASDFCSLEERDYYDWVHLTLAGSLKFTKSLYSALNIPFTVEK